MLMFIFYYFEEYCQIYNYIDMATPILTKKQQRQSLSAKKGPVKGLRNILAQPNLNFWPVINVDQYPELITNLNTTLPSIKRPDKIPLHVLKNIPKKDRALAKKEILEKAPPKPDTLKFIIMGVNAVTRALEKDNICCVLLDANVKPPLLIEHIVTMAVNKKIPVLLLPILKTITLEKMGFATIVFALKQEVMLCSDNVCHLLYKLIAEAFKDFELPERLQHFKPDETSDKSAMCEAKNTGTDCDTILNISKQKKPVVFTDVYKYRSSRDNRAFIPPAVNKNFQVSQTPTNEFIALSNDPDPADDKLCTNILKNRRYVNIGKEEKNTEKSENTGKVQCDSVSKLINNNADSSKRIEKLKRRRNDEPNYLSLKIKRIQGSNNRRKATKFPKTKIKKQKISHCDEDKKEKHKLNPKATM